MDWTFQCTENTRILFKQILDELSVEELNKIPEGFNNNIFWNIAHAMVTQQVLAYKLSGLEVPIGPDWVASYAKGTKPTVNVNAEEVDVLKELLFSTLEQVKKDYKAGVFKEFTTYTVSTNNSTLTNIDEALAFSNYHEGMHYGYVLAQKRAIKS